MIQRSILPTKLFPDRFFHVGGDEVNGKPWGANQHIQEFMRAHGLQNNAALQAYFNRRLQPLVEKHGKSMIGWDEILDPSLPKDVTIHSWRGATGLAAAAKQGYRAILSNGYYLDLGWSAARHYAVDPLGGDAANLSPEEQKRILGGEACMWSEYVDAENVDSRIWPRNSAIAERLWSPAEVRDPVSMYARMNSISEQLEWRGLTHRSYYRRMLERIAGYGATPEEFQALKTLADLVEPVKDYGREQTAPAQPTSFSPMNRVVDEVHLESDAGRRFGEAVDKFIATSCRDSDAAARLRGQFTAWRDNDTALQPLLERSFLVKEVQATSSDLASLGRMGLGALEATPRGPASAGGEKAQQLAALEQMKKPKAQLLLTPAPALQKLLEALSLAGACAGAQP